MIDTKDLAVRAKTCLGCHLGRGEQVVDHEMIAAGHPDLAFELDTFTFAQPAHLPRAEAGRPSAGLGRRAEHRAWRKGCDCWRSTPSRSWPEYSDLECYQCHHDLRLESWRIQRGYGARKPGSAASEPRAVCGAA